jgi:hypothetical protein
MSARLLLVVLTFSSCQSGAKGVPPGIDFSGVEMFLELTALLEKDIEPSPERWEAMFSSPGYDVLVRKEFSREFFLERFRLAFMPSRKTALEKKLRDEKGFRAQFLPHYVQVKKRRPEVELQIHELKRGSFVRDAIEKAKQFLPSSVGEGNPPISFVIFGPDARGYSPVVIDVLDSIDNQDAFSSFLAHELHHYYRNQLFDYAQEEDIVWVMNQIQSEGIADQINVGKWFHDEELFSSNAQKGRNKEYLETYARSPEIIQEMDALFRQMFREPSRRLELGDRLRDLVPLSGHTVGFYMANMIIDNLGKRALVEGLGNPFAFFTLYSKAAGQKGLGTPAFSEDSLRFFQDLGKRYVVD